ncbi:MAG: histidine phosphatase family protein [Alphaproteobacteria bacterium]|nr:histidine phosphatase family protein [Alphaproteobacteria bacterium]
MNATRIIAIRHGETAWNVDTRIQGQLDVELNETGHWQARQAATALQGEDIAAIYASDLSRAFQTAQAIGSAVGVKPVSTVALRERHFGHFQTRTWSEIETLWPEQAHLWRTRVPDWSPDGGESLLELRERISSVVAELAQRHMGEQIVLVSHGGVMDVLYRLATGQELQAPRTWSLSNAAINRLLWTPQGLSLVGWGDDSHLQQVARDETSA